LLVVAYLPCLQDTIEGKLEKRTKGVFAPAGGKRLVTFIDDLCVDRVEYLQWALQAGFVMLGLHVKPCLLLILRAVCLA
jgi:hypothetical protein